MAGSLAPFAPDEGYLDFLLAVSTGADLSPWLARLLLGPPAAGRALTAAGVAEAGYAGYLAQAFTWLAPAVGLSGPDLVGTAELTFEASADSAPGTQNVAGWYVTDGPGKLCLVFYFPAPVDFAVTGAVVRFTPYLPAGRR